MKRALLIGAGTIVGTAAVLAYHPGSLFGTGIDASATTAFAEVTPALATDTGATTTAGDAAQAPSSTGTTPSPSTETAQTKTARAKTKPAPQTAKGASGKTAASAAPAPQAASPQAAAPANGTFTGSPARTQFGPVQVQITVNNGQITGVVGQQAATDGRSQMIASVAIPKLQQQAVAAQSANINGVSGASYTSGGFAKSLQSALKQAGLG
jgi:uncharacterized protein with FMN-binding domain